MRRAVLLTALFTTAAIARPRAAPPPAPDPSLVATQLKERALASDEAYNELRELCDSVGHRISGSPALDRAIEWGAAHMREDGLVVTKEPVLVPKWVRGPASLAMTSPHARPMQLLALGNSVSTPATGIEAEVLVVSSFDELTTRAAEAKGRIVVWDVPFTDYGATVPYRTQGATAAARAGALASLTRSVTNESLYTPHTGNQRYGGDVMPIPTAAITTEDAATMHRMQEAGLPVRLRLTLTASNEADVLSANVVGEIRGREAGEIVVLGCHLDSWDVGQGAQDDGAGCVTIMEAGAQLAALPVPPRRTVRVVLYTNEENGLRGGLGYAEAHAAERIVFAVEDDTGAGAPVGFGLDARIGDDPDNARMDAFRANLGLASEWLAPLGAADFSQAGGGADIGPLVGQGTFGFGLEHDMTGYWRIHHTETDTFDKVDPELVKQNVAAMTLFAWYLAEVAVVPPPSTPSP